ncbi:methyltransferase domain-containing protein [Novosphingobium bradum]|uniref:Methyltransferase domain-containing protein n=1 Tax=Novosphingobium bradum TaxID=1737444 RepID=A0ABV7IT64_9SPHN
MASTPPQIFAPQRRAAIHRRMATLQQAPDAARYLHADIAEDTVERLGFLRHQPGRVLVLGDAGGTLASALGPTGAELVAPPPAFSLEQPWPIGGFDLIVAALALDTTNDLPGALVHARMALAPGGLLLATLLGAGSLPALRAIMLAADADRPSPRLHPQIDVRAGAQLLQRAGLADPVADSRSLTVRFSSLPRLVGDLREQGLSSALVRGGPPLTRAAHRRALGAFTERAEADGKVTERFELLTLSGWLRG